MTKRRVLAIWLDGYEQSLGESLMASGSLPALARMKKKGLHALLDHGAAQRTGLAGEHVSTGLAPESAQRWAAVSFDPWSYQVWQEGTALTPFPRQLESSTVVFDMPYFDLRQAPQVRGLVNWGAHDPGVATQACPDGLHAEFVARFGNYPATEFIYGLPWSSPKMSRRMGEALTEAVDLRTKAARWLLQERCADWDLALVAVSEPHSAIEGLWHGVDAEHPLHQLPSAGPAGEGLKSVYRGVDRLVGELVEAFPDVTTLVFSTGGMGPNRSDVPSMVLLAELMYRNAYGRELLQSRADWVAAPNGTPILRADEKWNSSVMSLIPRPGARESSDNAVRRMIAPWIPTPVKRSLRKLTATRPKPKPTVDESDGPLRLSIDWMPATRYQPYWREMPAFALPSFYDGRIRINLIGRESAGLIEPSDYVAMCDDLEALLRECRDPATGESVVDFIERPGAGRDPLTLGPTESDLVVIWRGPLALDHPRLGLMGPLPYRRAGGHTGPYGMLYLQGPDSTPLDCDIRSAFDVVPTIVDLLGEPEPANLSGTAIRLERAVGVDQV